MFQALAFVGDLSKSTLLLQIESQADFSRRTWALHELVDNAACEIHKLNDFVRGPATPNVLGSNHCDFRCLFCCDWSSSMDVWKYTRAV
jgi:hypothetical protein